MRLGLCVLRSFVIAAVPLSEEARKGEPKHPITDQASSLIQRFKETAGIPGLSVVIAVNGNTVFRKGFGYTDVEQLTPARCDSVFRIASISKSLTSILIGRLLDQKKLDLTDDVRTYFPEFPTKTMDGRYAKLTIASLMNHTSGIRSYKEVKTPDDAFPHHPEMFLNKRFSSTTEACDLFKDDPLVTAPGDKYAYSTLAYTLLSAVIERVSIAKGPAVGCQTTEQPPTSTAGVEHSEVPKWARIDTQLTQLFKLMALSSTSLEYHETITANRSRQYRRTAKGLLVNTQTVDQSYKWAGGGILSNATDLTRVANHLCAIYLGLASGVISRQGLGQLWQESLPEQIKTSNGDWRPGLGWFIWRRPVYLPNAYHSDLSHCSKHRLYVTHTGAAVGGTTVILMSLPCLCSVADLSCQTKLWNADLSSSGSVVSVVILTNLEQASGIAHLATELADLFSPIPADTICSSHNSCQSSVNNTEAPSSRCIVPPATVS